MLGFDIQAVKDMGLASARQDLIQYFRDPLSSGERYVDFSSTLAKHQAQAALVPCSLTVTDLSPHEHSASRRSSYFVIRARLSGRRAVVSHEASLQDGKLMNNGRIG